MVIFDKHKKILKDWSSSPKMIKQYHLEEDFEKFILDLFSYYKVEIHTLNDDNIWMKKYSSRGFEEIIPPFCVKKMFGISVKEFMEQYKWFENIVFRGYINLYAGRVEVDDISIIPKQPKYHLIHN